VQMADGQTYFVNHMDSGSGNILNLNASMFPLATSTQSGTTANQINSTPTITLPQGVLGGANIVSALIFF